MVNNMKKRGSSIAIVSLLTMAAIVGIVIYTREHYDKNALSRESDEKYRGYMCEQLETVIADVIPGAEIKASWEEKTEIVVELSGIDKKDEGLDEKEDKIRKMIQSQLDDDVEIVFVE